MMEAEARSNRFSHLMGGQSIPMLGQMRVGTGGTGNNGLAVSKQPGRSIKGISKGTKGKLQIHDLFDGCTGGHKLTSIGCSFKLTLSVGEPVNGGLVNHVKRASGRPASDSIMDQSSINPGGSLYRLLFWQRKALWNSFFRLPIDRVHPIVLGGVLPKLGLVVWDASSEMDYSMGILVGTGDLGATR